MLAAFTGFALVARGPLHLVSAASFVGFGGAFAVLEVAGDVGVGITALAWPEPTRLSLALLVGLWAIVRALVGARSPSRPAADRPWWLLSLVVAVAAGGLGVILIARSNGSLRGTAVTIGVLLLLEGTREVSEAALRERQQRRIRRIRRAAHAPAAAS